MNARPFIVALVCTALPAWAEASPADRPDPARYRPHVEDKVIKAIKDRNEARDADEKKATANIRENQKTEKKLKKDSRKDLIADLPASRRPASLEIFGAPFHFAPVAQYYTGTCWSFAGTSYLESEIHRIRGRKVKMSEMFTVYWEYVEKARRFVARRGDSAFGEGSQLNSVTRMWKKHGAVPHELFPGILAEDGWHDHSRMHREMNQYLEHAKATDLWDEALVLANIHAIMERYLGRPPAEFQWEGRQYTPVTFVTDYLGLDPDAYVQFMSTTREPLFQTALFDVPDNWWLDDTYHNVPLEDFYGVVGQAVEAGYTVGLGGDVSEPGKNPEQDVAFVPDFDIPPGLITQDVREYRIHNKSTGDDHGIHLLGRATVDGSDWYLIKDSGRSARKGKFKGYYFFREDFIRLKMLTVMVHRDVAPALLERFGKKK
ncbi:MAG: peptidase C1 [Deltaproteobacteria bacterium]|nr:peptidase C1 [Deltaproteobacteria bacterium]